MLLFDCEVNYRFSCPLIVDHYQCTSHFRHVVPLVIPLPLRKPLDSAPTVFHRLLQAGEVLLLSLDVAGPRPLKATVKYSVVHRLHFELGRAF